MLTTTKTTTTPATTSTTTSTSTTTTTREATNGQQPRPRAPKQLADAEDADDDEFEVVGIDEGLLGGQADPGELPEGEEEQASEKFRLSR